MSVRLANKALRRIHAANISALDGSTEVKRIIQDEMDDAVDYVLRKHNWTDETAAFCPTEALVCDPCCDLPEGYEFAFHLPKDYLKMVKVSPKVTRKDCEPPDMQWKIGKFDGCAVLLTDCKPIRGEYVCKPANLDGLPPDLFEAIYLKLAYELVPPLQADKSLRAEIMAEFERAFTTASNTSDEHDQTDVFLDEQGELLDARDCMWHYGSYHYNSRDGRRRHG